MLLLTMILMLRLSVCACVFVYHARNDTNRLNRDVTMLPVRLMSNLARSLLYPLTYVT